MPIAVVGAGPAGTRAAEVLVRSGLRPVVIEEAAGNGGRIYQRQPAEHTRRGRALYGFEAGRATRLHAAFEAIADRIDHRPNTLVWNMRAGMLNVMTDGVPGEIAFSHVVLCPGATDRIVPLPGWTLPGVFTLGGAQIALKSQGCAIGRRVVFIGTGPLLWLAAYQYARAGAEVAAVLDTTKLATKLDQVPGLLHGGVTLAKGLYYVGWLRAHGIRVVEGAAPEAIEGDNDVTGVRWQGGRTYCDAVAIGWGLKPEAQLADLAGVPFAWRALHRAWLPEMDSAGRTAVPGVMLAGDGALIGGADVAELAGARAAWAVVEDLGQPVDAKEVARLDRTLVRQARFRHALESAFPYPAQLAAAVPDDTVVCRCEAIRAGELRAAARGTPTLAAPEVNRAKAFTRVGMGRCQGRVCGPPGAEILAQALGCPVEQVGRLRGQAPVKPIPVLA